ncbi:MAG: hypothetical protein ACJ73S_14160 [Mycobacteriales bacterium]
MLVKALRRLDDRVVPTLARVVQAVTGTGRRDAAGRDGAPPAHRGRLVAGVALLVAAVVLGAAAYAYQRHGGQDRAAAGNTPVHVGLATDQPVADYLNKASLNLVALARNTTITTYALVSLGGYGTPDQVVKLVDGFSVARAFVRVPLAGTTTKTVSVRVRTLATDLPAGMAAAARKRLADASEFDNLAKKVVGEDEQSTELRSFYVSSATVARSEAAQLQKACACVYALLVRGKPDRLLDLSRTPGVRVVDPAPEISDLERTVFAPLLPEQLAQPATPSPTPSASTSSR